MTLQGELKVKDEKPNSDFASTPENADPAEKLNDILEKLGYSLGVFRSMFLQNVDKSKLEESIFENIALNMIDKYSLNQRSFTLLFSDKSLFNALTSILEKKETAEIIKILKDYINSKKNNS